MHRWHLRFAHFGRTAAHLNRILRSQFAIDRICHHRLLRSRDRSAFKHRAVLVAVAWSSTATWRQKLSEVSVSEMPKLSFRKLSRISKRFAVGIANQILRILIKMLAVDVRRHGIDGETHVVRAVPRQGATAVGNIAYRNQRRHLFPCCGRSERLVSNTVLRR